MADHQTGGIRMHTTRESVFVESHQSRIPPSGCMVQNHSGNEVLPITDGSRSVDYDAASPAARIGVLPPPGFHKFEIKESGHRRLNEIPSHEDIKI